MHNDENNALWCHRFQFTVILFHHKCFVSIIIIIGAMHPINLDKWNLISFFYLHIYNCITGVRVCDLWLSCCYPGYERTWSDRWTLRQAGDNDLTRIDHPRHGQASHGWPAAQSAACHCGRAGLLDDRAARLEYLRDQTGRCWRRAGQRDDAARLVTKSWCRSINGYVND